MHRHLNCKTFYTKKLVEQSLLEKHVKCNTFCCFSFWTKMQKLLLAYFYSNPPIFEHRIICNIYDILHLCKWTNNHTGVTPLLFLRQSACRFTKVKVVSLELFNNEKSCIFQSTYNVIAMAPAILANLWCTSKI